MWINKPFDQRWPIPVSNYTKCIIIFHMVVCCIKECSDRANYSAMARQSNGKFTSN